MKLSLLFVFLFLTCQGQKNEVVEKTLPKFNLVQEVISDNSKLFTTDQKDILAKRLIEYQAQTTNQVVVITDDSITPYTNIQKYATDLSNDLGVGQKDKNNGLVIVVSDKLRQVSIATGTGTEKILTDSICKQIIDSTIIPQLRNKDYYQGISMALDSLIYKWQ